MKAWQNLITSISDFPLGSKSAPPFPPPIGNPVNEFLKDKTVLITGGLSGNKFFAGILAKKLNKVVITLEYGRYAGAYGAALLAREKDV